MAVSILLFVIGSLPVVSILCLVRRPACGQGVPKSAVQGAPVLPLLM